MSDTISCRMVSDTFSNLKIQIYCNSPFLISDFVKNANVVKGENMFRLTDMVKDRELLKGFNCLVRPPFQTSLKDCIKTLHPTFIFAIWSNQ